MDEEEEEEEEEEEGEKASLCLVTSDFKPHQSNAVFRHELFLLIIILTWFCLVVACRTVPSRRRGTARCLLPKPRSRPLTTPLQVPVSGDHHAHSPDLSHVKLKP